MSRQDSALAVAPDVDVMVVGAGFGGLCALHELRRNGLNVAAIEAGHDVGGVWFWNTYPGARCDVESVDYCYSFDDALIEDWVWTERYPAQPEILAYLRHVADRLDLRRHITFDKNVTALHWSNLKKYWVVSTDDGHRTTARYVVMAVGQLSVAKSPDIAGVDTFAGPVLHTSSWPHDEPDGLAGRVGVIGTGSSGVQVIPQLAKRARELTVFQRTAHYALPAGNAPLPTSDLQSARATFRERRALARRHPSGTLQSPGDTPISATPAPNVRRRFDECWAAGGTDFMWSFSDLRSSMDSNEIAAEYIRDRIRSIVDDETTARALSPKGYPLGSKRIVLEIDYWRTYNRSNVSLVDLRRDPLSAVEPKGVRLGSGFRELDVIVLATGFDAFTGAYERIDIHGVCSTLQESWHKGPVSYLGLLTHGFPNLFMLAGAGSPSVLTNVVIAIEQQVEWLSKLLAKMREESLPVVEAQASAQATWSHEVARVAETSLLVKGGSWYQGANVPGKPRVFLPYAGGLDRYSDRCDQEAANGYPGLAFSKALD